MCYLRMEVGRGNNKTLERKKERELDPSSQMVWKLFGNLVILHRSFFAMSNCSGEEKSFICVKTQGWFEENVDGHTWHVFPSCQG